MSARSLALAGALALAGLASSCHHARTQIVLRLDTDMSQGPTGTLTDVRVQVLSQDTGDVVYDQSHPLGVGASPVYLPADVLGITPRGDDPSRRVRVEVGAYNHVDLLFTHTSVAPFIPDQTAVLSVFLADRCRYLRCSATQTCERGGCVDQNTTPVALGDSGIGDVARMPDAAGECPALQSRCGDSCVDLSDDSMHCGACETACAAGESCTAAQCVAATNSGVTAVITGFSHTCVRRSSGEIDCWGSGELGQTGAAPLGSTDVLAPAPTDIPTDGDGAVAGGDFNCIIRAGGNVSCWGDAQFLQLGATTVSSQETMWPVQGATGAVHLGAGEYHACMIDGAGTVWCWGRNDAAQLGRGTRTRAEGSLAMVTGVSNAVEVTGGFNHTCARATSGAVSCWGDDAQGQLGDGVTGGVKGPTPAQGITDAISLAAGEFHTCVVRAGGAVWCWGSNDAGQTGQGASVPSNPMPAMVPGITDAMSVVAGGSHTCALRRGGGVVCWGANDRGQGGVAATGNLYAPTTVTGLPLAVQIDTRDTHVCARHADGSVHCWGSDDHAQLGDGRHADAATPVLVPGIP